MRTPQPARLPEGGTRAERLVLAIRMVLTVPKVALLKEKAKRERGRKRKPTVEQLAPH